MSFNCEIIDGNSVSICDNEDNNNLSICMKDDGDTHIVDLNKEDAIAFANAILAFYAKGS